MANNSVTLLGYYGGDERHCLSAWQSTNIELEDDLAGTMPDEISKRIHWLFEQTVIQKKKSPQELLKMLAQNDPPHGSPFEKSILDFQVTAEVASHIHAIKHRIAVSINSESSRYKELKDKWYLPEDWKSIYVKDTQYLGYGSQRLTWADLLNEQTKLSHRIYHQALKELTPVLGRKRAKESARYFLPYNKQLDFDICFNFRSFMHFQGLRNSDRAQDEIHWIADEMLRLVKDIRDDNNENPFEYSLAAFGY
jgi:flavin-dependent thymidylate synthase